MIVIVDAGMGNIGSLQNMLRHLGHEATSGTSPEQLAAATRLLLPGVGAFDRGMERLEAAGLVAPLCERASAGVPLLGICLGMQLLGRASEEGVRPGLGLLPMHSVRFNFSPEQKLRVPHMGWNECVPARSSTLLDAVPVPRRFYFVHSYRVVCDTPDCIAGKTPYGGEFVSAVQQGRIYGVQFHPEKSHRYGMALLDQFVHEG